METVVITKELFDELVLEKATQLRQKERTHCIGLKEAKKILGIKSNDTFYRKVKAKGSLIRRGSVWGTYIEKSIFKERDKYN